MFEGERGHTSPQNPWAWTDPWCIDKGPCCSNSYWSKKSILFHLGGTTTTRMEIIKYSLVNRRVRSKRCGCCLKTMKSEQEGKCFISNNRHAGRVKREERERKEDAGA